MKPPRKVAPKRATPHKVTPRKRVQEPSSDGKVTVGFRVDSTIQKKLVKKIAGKSSISAYLCDLVTTHVKGVRL